MSKTREVAEHIVGALNWMDFKSLAPKQLIDAIDKALQAERERAARIIKEHRESDRCEGSCWEIITTAIREGKLQE